MCETRKANPLWQAIESQNQKLKSSVEKLKTELQQSNKAKSKIERQYNQLKLKLQTSMHSLMPYSQPQSPVNNEEETPPRRQNDPNNSYQMHESQADHYGLNQSCLQSPDTSLIYRYVKRRNSMNNSHETPEKKRKLSTLAEKRKFDWPDGGTVLMLKKTDGQRMHRDNYYDRCLKKK